MNINSIIFKVQCVLALLIAPTIYGQSGDFILTHHAPKHSEIDNVNFQITADNNGIMCIANRFGLLKYDGIEWDFFATNSSAISLVVTDDNTVYIGGIGEFGKMAYVNNTYEYVPLIENDTLSDHFLQTFHLDETIYFLSGSNLYGYDYENDTLSHVSSGNFLNGYISNQKLYLNTDNGKVVHVTGFNTDTYDPDRLRWGIIQTSPSQENTIGIALNGELFLWEKNVPVRLLQNDKIQEAKITLTDLSWVNDTLVACSTIESGVFFLSTTDPLYFEITDYHSGLPDNEIHDLFADNNGGVWVAHEFGLTRIAPLFPAYSYTSFPGIDGNLIEAQRLHGDLWINTSLGVYYFSQDTSYQSKVYRERIIKQTKRRVPVVQIKEDEQELQKESEPGIVETEKEPKKKGFLKGLFRKKNRAEKTKTPIREQGISKKTFKETIAEPTSRDIIKDNIQFIRRVERIMTGITYQFHHVSGTDGKFKQLLGTPDRILGTSHTGIYEITKKEAQLVINEPVRYAYLIPDSNHLLISTEDGYLKSYMLINNIWLKTSQQYFEDAILNVYRDHQNHIWLAGTSHIYRGRFEDLIFLIEEAYEVNNRFFDELSIWERDGELYFINSLGYFHFDRSVEQIIKDEKLAEEIGMPHHHLHNEKSRVWIYNGKIWHQLTPDGSIHEFSYLGVYPDLKYISYDEKLHRFWLVTQDNQLLAYSAEVANSKYDSYDLFVKRILGKSGEQKFNEYLKFKHDENYVSIEMLKPDYLGILNPEYQYKLVGLNHEWSSWTHGNLIDYSFIPPGKYELIVRVRDSFGETEESKLISFSVDTPYWQTPWFYAIQVLILGLFVAVAARLSDEKVANQVVKHMLSILTLVIIIQLLQAIVGSYLNIESTPVVDFMVDATTALFVFPLEWILRKVMIEGGVDLAKIKTSRSR